MPVINAAAAGAAAAARAAELRRQEEEEMTPYDSHDVERYEFKIIRSATGMFKRPARLRDVLEEEARAGWQLVEKFDNGRLRLKRQIECRQKDATLGQDPYRTTVGMSEGKLALWIVLGIFGGAATVMLLILAIVKGT